MPPPKKKKSIKFSTIEILNCSYFANFFWFSCNFPILVDNLNHILLHVTSIHVNAWTYLMLVFFTLKFIAQSLQCVHVNKAYYKFKFHLKFIGLYFVKSSMAKFLLKKKNSVELGKILMFVQILWKIKVVCYKDIKTNSMRFNVPWSVLLN